MMWRNAEGFCCSHERDSDKHQEVSRPTSATHLHDSEGVSLVGLGALRADGYMVSSDSEQD